MAPGIRPVIRASTTVEESSSSRRFPAAFQLPPLASRAFLFPPRIYAVLTDGLPAAGQFRWTTTGLPCSTLARHDRCRAPPIPRDRGAHMTGNGIPVTTAASQRRVLSHVHTSHLPWFRMTRLTEVHLRSPFPVFPLPVTDGWNTGPWASSWASHPTVTSDACQKQGRVSNTHSRSTTIHTVLHSVNPLNQYDFTSHPTAAAPVCPGANR